MALCRGGGGDGATPAGSKSNDAKKPRVKLEFNTFQWYISDSHPTPRSFALSSEKKRP